MEPWSLLKLILPLWAGTRCAFYSAPPLLSSTDAKMSQEKGLRLIKSPQNVAVLFPFFYCSSSLEPNAHPTQ